MTVMFLGVSREVQCAVDRIRMWNAGAWHWSAPSAIGEEQGLVATRCQPTNTQPVVSQGRPEGKAPSEPDCRSPVVRCGRASALSIPHRAHAGPTTRIGAGFRMLPCGVQRCCTCPRRGESCGDRFDRHRDPAARDHRRQDFRAAGLAGGGTERGVGPVGERCTASVEKLPRIAHRQAKGQGGWSATDEVEERSYSRRRAGGETKRLWSLNKPFHSGGAGR